MEKSTQIGNKPANKKSNRLSNRRTPESQLQSSSFHSNSSIAGNEDEAMLRIYNLNEEIKVTKPIKRGARKSSPNPALQTIADEPRQQANEGLVRQTNDQRSYGKLRHGSFEERKSSLSEGKSESKLYRSGGHLLSRGSRMYSMFESRNHSPINLDTTPKHTDRALDSSDVSYDALPDIRRSALPTHDMKRYLKQAASRRQS